MNVYFYHIVFLFLLKIKTWISSGEMKAMKPTFGGFELSLPLLTCSVNLCKLFSVSESLFNYYIGIAIVPTSAGEIYLFGLYFGF